MPVGNIDCSVRVTYAIIHPYGKLIIARIAKRPGIGQPGRRNKASCAGHGFRKAAQCAVKWIGQNGPLLCLPGRLVINR